MIRHLEQFVKPHDGTVEQLTPQDQEAVVSEFCGLIDGALESYTDTADVSHYENLSNTATLNLGYRLENGGGIVITIGTLQTDAGSSLHNREIAIQEFDPNREFVRSHVYHFSPGSLEVVRSDLFRPIPEEIAMKNEAYRERQKILSASMTEAELIAEAYRMRAQRHKNGELDRQMGFNHLPVELEEIKALTELISVAQPFV